MSPSAALTEPTTGAELYLDLLKKCLTRSIFLECFRVVDPPRGSIRDLIYAPIRAWLRRTNKNSCSIAPADEAERTGRHRCQASTTHDRIHLDTTSVHCIIDVLRNQVRGDVIETGVWRGGATIFMRAVLKAYGDTTRTVWVADLVRRPSEA
jgi:O-methyltransferase